jgi:lipopolysaccharide/colanic/teichoic acid biosynthesis glycosyltransferase
MQESEVSVAVDAYQSLSRPETKTGDRLSYRIAKRTTDLVLGLILFLIALPIIVAAAFLIWLESSGSPFFFQTRLGKGGKQFKLFKLRGMYRDSRERFPDLYDYSQNKSLDFYFHYEGDPRVTRVGRFLRRTSIDELPNFWNVITGDMSLVGPRPEIPEILNMYGRYRNEYLSVKPGITCLSKCTGRDRLTKKETIHIDLAYVRRRCFKLDLLVLWRTFKGVVLRKNVY